jgi:alpha-galactosidase
VRGYEGSYGHEEQDAKTYAGWGVDFLKYGLCGLRPIIRLYDPEQDPKKSSAMMRDAYAKMRDALAKAGRGRSARR